MTMLLEPTDPRQEIDTTGTKNDPRALTGHHAYLPWEFVHFSLPYRDPKTTIWHRENGLSSMTITAGAFLNSDQTVRHQLPFGKYARASLLWAMTEAKVTNNPVLCLGSSLREFMGKVGITYGSRQGSLCLEQMHNLFGATIAFHKATTDETGKVNTIAQRTLISSGSNIWFSSKDSSEMDSVLPSTVTLSKEMFGSVLESGPINLTAWRWVQETSSSSMALDIYVWLSARIFKLSKPTRITWEQLHQQFGSTSEMKKFKQNFRAALHQALEAYPAANVKEIGEGDRGKGFKGLILSPSPLATESYPAGYEPL